MEKVGVKFFGGVQYEELLYKGVPGGPENSAKAEESGRTLTNEKGVKKGLKGEKGRIMIRVTREAQIHYEKGTEKVEYSTAVQPRYGTGVT